MQAERDPPLYVRIMAQLPNTLSMTLAPPRIAGTITCRSSSASACDAVLAAAARAAGADALVSADTGFSSITAVHHVVPDAGGIVQLLGISEQ